MVCFKAVSLSPASTGLCFLSLCCPQMPSVPPCSDLWQPPQPLWSQQIRWYLWDSPPWLPRTFAQSLIPTCPRSPVPPNTPAASPKHAAPCSHPAKCPGVPSPAPRHGRAHSPVAMDGKDNRQWWSRQEPPARGEEHQETCTALTATPRGQATLSPQLRLYTGHAQARARTSLATCLHCGFLTCSFQLQ